MTGPRDAAAVRVFPPGVPLLAVLLALGLDRLWPLAPGVEVPEPVRYWLGGGIVAGAVLGLGLWSVVLFRRSAGEWRWMRRSSAARKRGSRAAARKGRRS